MLLVSAIYKEGQCMNSGRDEASRMHSVLHYTHKGNFSMLKASVHNGLPHAGHYSQIRRGLHTFLFILLV